MKGFSQAVQDVKSIGALHSLLHSTLQDFGFSLFACFSVTPLNGVLLEQTPAYVSSYPRKWIYHYLLSRYFEKDPIVAIGKSRRSPFYWDGGIEGLNAIPDQPRVLEEAADFGIKRGFSIPIHGPGSEFGLFTVAAGDSASTFEAALSENSQNLQTIATCTHEKIVDRVLRGRNPYKVALTKNEKQVLIWAARGKTSWETAKIIARSEATVNYHLKRAIKKLDAVNKCHAAVKATTYNLLEY